MNDWKDALSALQGIIPGDSAEVGESEPHTSSASPEATAQYPVLTVFFEKKGRAGKPATIITGFNLGDESSLAEAENLARTLKQRLGCGGSARGGEILLQGDRRAQLKSLLPSLNYRKIKGL